MKTLYTLLLISLSINISLSLRHHNSNKEYTKITKKIMPDSELCNEQNCPIDRGTCSGENFCFCFDGYISTYESSTLCDYAQKDRTLYFLLEFILGFGIGHFYIGKYIYASIKLFVYCSLLVIPSERYFINFWPLKLNIFFSFCFKIARISVNIVFHPFKMKSSQISKRKEKSLSGKDK